MNDDNVEYSGNDAGSFTNDINSKDEETELSIKTRLLAESISKEQDVFPQGCVFSPDGSCILTAKANKIELYNTPNQSTDAAGTNTPVVPSSWEPVLTYETGDSVRSYSWYPHMKSIDPTSCCFVGVSRDAPVHLYDAYTGMIRASYRPYNGLDEMESPTTICFAENGQKLITGGFRTDRVLHIFDLNRPGRQSSTILKLGKTRRSKDGQKGLVSSMTFSESNGIVAVGTYSPGSIYLYDLRTYCSAPVAEIIMSGTCIAGHGKSHGKNRKFVVDDNNANAGNDTEVSNNETPTLFDFSAAKLQWYHNKARTGVTQLDFDETNTGTYQYLFSTSRRSNCILQWDLRKLSSSNFCPGIASYEVDNDTNQRIEFRLHGEYLWTGGKDKCIRIYNRKTGKLATALEGFRDSVNGISLHDYHHESSSKRTFMAITTGTRHFPSNEDWENEDPHDALLSRSEDFGSTVVYGVVI